MLGKVEKCPLLPESKMSGGIFGGGVERVCAVTCEVKTAHPESQVFEGCGDPFVEIVVLLMEGRENQQKRVHLVRVFQTTQVKEGCL